METRAMSDVDMGTREQAEERFIAACDDWIALRQPIMASPRELRNRDACEREARFQLANAAIHLAWFMRGGKAP